MHNPFLVVVGKVLRPDRSVMFLDIVLHENGRPIRSVMVRPRLVRAVIEDPELVMTGRLLSTGTLQFGAKLHVYGEDSFQTDANASYEDNYNNLPTRPLPTTP